ncbi:hypothetical protein H2200_012023 [Cladophialophora chaetospira]|uniref:Uncharacterized protein n=1 Tax=Cladophialophora chaetospira TaxID=386627 RepID=A0AA39CCJ9_9EURO|nr:hypothetical protein H2200_012023 [Cladophialophora chaetospira]
MAGNISFIPYFPNKTRFRSDYELTQSKARSHAAKAVYRVNANRVVYDKHCSITWSYRQHYVTSHIRTQYDDRQRPPRAPSGDTACFSPSRISIEQLVVKADEDDAPETQHESIEEPKQQRKPDMAMAKQSPWHWSRGARVDPFDCVSGGDGYETSFYVDFLVHYVMPTVASINEAFNVVNVYGAWMLENMAKYEDFFHILLGLTKVAHTAIAKPGSPLPQAAFVHAGRAMSKLRGRLAKPNAKADDGAILTILFLAMFERGLGNSSAWEAHRDQVDKMVASCGGVEQLGVNSSARAALTVYAFTRLLQQPSSRETRLIIYRLLSLSGEPPPKPTLARGPTLHFPDEDQMKLIIDLPIGFQNLVRTGALSSETINIIRRINAKRDWSPQDSNYAERQGEARSKVFRPVTGQAWNFRDACTAFRTPDGPDGPSLEHLLCLALFRYCANRANRFRPRACIYHSATTHLTAKLPSFKLPDSRTERDCIIWIWLVAMDSLSLSINCSELSEEGVLFLSSMRKALPELVNWEWWDLEALGQKFFWRDDLHLLLQENWISPHQRQ